MNFKVLWNIRNILLLYILLHFNLHCHYVGNYPLNHKLKALFIGFKFFQPMKKIFFAMVMIFIIFFALLLNSFKKLKLSTIPNIFYILLSLFYLLSIYFSLWFQTRETWNIWWYFVYQEECWNKYFIPAC